MASLSIFGLIFLLLNCAAVVIKTKQGSLKGLVLESRNGTKYNAFLGIPFAKPPVGQLRFEPPQHPDSWTDVRDATKVGPKCFQTWPGFFEFFGTDKGQEDCLYANVYTPSKPRTQSKIPVMVWIHGGAFVIGSGDMYDPKYFLDHEIIIVSFNYRVGALGFLSAADEVLPGNYGLKDQIAVLKWVQEYIADFGGDPQRVTIAGVSAGGASVHLLMHSPLSEGLFHAAISHSGSALTHWAQIPPLAARQKLNAFGILAGCSTESTRVLVDCLKNISAEEISTIQEKFYVCDWTPINLFPLVKEPANVKDAFLREDPWKQKVLMDVPFIVTFNSAEGANFVARFICEEKLANKLDADYKRLFPVIFSYLHWFKNEDVIRITESLRQFYLGDRKIGLETAPDVVKLWSDGFFNYDIMEAAYRHTNKVYVLYYDRIGSQRFDNTVENCSIDLGVAHGEDCFCFFPFSKYVKLSNESSTDLEVSERLLKYWINFAYTGTPTLDNSWLPSESEKELTYLHVQNDGISLKTGLLQDRYSFWKNLGVHPHSETRNSFVSDEL